MLLTIRTFSGDDWAGYRRLRLRALADSPTAFGSTLAREQAFTETDWRRRAGRPGTFHADDDDRPVGLAGTHWPASDVGEPDARRTAELVSMWVAPEARGVGVGHALVAAVGGHARAVGCLRLVLWVVEGNEAAARLYRSVGFTSTGCRQPVGAGDGRFEFEMALPLP